MKTCDLLCGGLHGGWSELERVSYVVTVAVSRKTLVLLRRKHDALVELLLRHRISLISVFPIFFGVSFESKGIHPFLSGNIWNAIVSSFPGADVNQTDRWGVSPRTILNVHGLSFWMVFFFTLEDFSET